MLTMPMGILWKGYRHCWHGCQHGPMKRCDNEWVRVCFSVGHWIQMIVWSLYSCEVRCLVLSLQQHSSEIPPSVNPFKLLQSIATAIASAKVCMYVVAPNCTEICIVQSTRIAYVICCNHWYVRLFAQPQSYCFDCCNFCKYLVTYSTYIHRFVCSHLHCYTTYVFVILNSFHSSVHIQDQLGVKAEELDLKQEVKWCTSDPVSSEPLKLKLKKAIAPGWVSFGMAACTLLICSCTYMYIHSLSTHIPIPCKSSMSCVASRGYRWIERTVCKLVPHWVFVPIAYLYVLISKAGWYFSIVSF